MANFIENISQTQGDFLWVFVRSAGSELKILQRRSTTQKDKVVKRNSTIFEVRAERDQKHLYQMPFLTIAFRKNIFLK